MADRVGERFADYELIRRLGGGEFGDVYLGKYLSNNTLVAIKILKARLTLAADLKEFIREVNILFQLQHPLIVPLLNFDVEDETPFLVMSNAPNGTLRQQKGTRLPLDTIVVYANQIAEALQFVHAHKLIHRDIKPENILLGPENNLWLSDFGITCIARSTQSLVTQKPAGTIQYMASEQINGEPRPASDQYALGVIIYEWLCGTRPFTGTFTEIISQHIHKAPPSLHEKIPDISPEVEEVVLKALSKDPYQRYENIQEFANALERASHPILIPPKENTDEQEPDSWIPDYEKSRGFLQSGQSGQAVPPASPTTPIQPEPEKLGEQTIEFPLSPTQYEPTSSAPSVLPRSTFPEQNILPPDPFNEFDDQLLVPLPEQRRPAFVQDIEGDVPDIADKPARVTGGYWIENLGEEEEAPPVGQKRQWPDLLGDDPEEYEPRRVYGSRSRSNHPIPPPQPSGEAAARATGGAAAQPQRPPRNVTLQQPRAPDRVNRTGAAPVARPVPRPAAKPRSSQRGSRVLAIVLILLLVLFLGGVGLFYYGTSATVTLTVSWRTLSESKLTLIASTNPQNKAQNTVVSQILSYTASASGTVPATGTTPQGSSIAKGNATVTNNGTAQIVIPLHTIISTSAGTGTLGIQFVTQPDALIQPGSSAQIPIQAQNAGVSGNVGAGKITIIPVDSLTAIAAYNHVSTASLNLSVTNPTATTGGGAINVPAATINDNATLKLKLHQQIQSQVKNWLQTQLHINDQHGTVIPDVQNSTMPLPDEVLTQATPVGQALPSSTVQGTLTVQVKMLVVREVAFQDAVQQQLNQIAGKMNPPYVITIAKVPIQFSGITASSSKGGTLLTITYNAVGQIVPYVNMSDLSSYLAGKTEDQARSSISSYEAGVLNVQSVDFTIFPSFLILLPFRPDHIHIVVRPGTSAT